jgi:magnesium transporter
VNPLYYVTFTTATLCASFILFSGFNTTDPNGHKMIMGRGDFDATGTDMVSSIQTRLSMQARRSTDPHRLSMSSQHGDRQGLIRAYDEEEAAGFGLTDLAEESDEDRDASRLNGTVNGHAKGYNDAIELQPQKPSDR